MGIFVYKRRCMPGRNFGLVPPHQTHQHHQYSHFFLPINNFYPPTFKMEPWYVQPFWQDELPTAVELFVTTYRIQPSRVVRQGKEASADR